MNSFTGALAIIKVQGEAVGKIQNIRVNENINRVDVRQLGDPIPVESPVVQWSGTLSCSIIEVDFDKGGIKNAIRRDVQSNEEYSDQLLLNPNGVQIDIFKKISDVIDPNTGLIRSTIKPFAVITKVLIDSDSFNINEGQVVLRDQSFRFLSPVIFPK
ncbi:hypothetical protein [Lutibacter sp.]|uniref:hypothetical protein n=1 Tax=Lutibacter sp. TaxID=1925666 RepID=UPI0034A0809D